jgi:hypothetical protein
LNKVAQKDYGDGFSPSSQKISCSSVGSFHVWTHWEMSKHLNTHLSVPTCRISHKMALFEDSGPAIMWEIEFYIQMCPQNGTWLGRFFQIWVWDPAKTQFQISKFLTKF